MACEKYVEFKPGDDLHWAGILEQENVVDYTGYEIAVEFRAKNRNSKMPDSLLATGVVTWTDEVAGQFVISVDRDITIEWPIGITIMMDVSVLHPAGHRVRSETLEIKTIPGVTETV